MIPTIPSYIVAAAFLLLAVEFIGRCIRTRPINYSFCGDALVYLYLGVTYLLYYLFEIPSDLRHVLIRFGIFLLAASRLIDVVAEHYWRWRGYERRNDWLKLHKRNHKG